MRRFTEVAAICGSIAPILTYVSILLAIGSYKQFNWINNALSDLGVIPGITMVLFNGGLIVGGALFAVFATGLFLLPIKSVFGRIGALFFFLACLSIICIGIFNESFKPTHYIVSVALFTLMPISLLILACAFWVSRQKRLSVFTLAVGLVTAIIWVLEYTIHYVSGVAIPEFTSGLVGAFWVLVLVNKLFKNHATSNLISEKRS